MLHDGARVAEQVGEPGMAKVLDVMTESLVSSQRHQNDLTTWRESDLRAIFERVPRT
jgi:hypothetical protein